MSDQPLTDQLELQRASRRRVVQERDGDPHWVDLGDGNFALHIQYGGNAVIVSVDSRGTADVSAFREWLEYVVSRTEEVARLERELQRCQEGPYA